MDTPPSDKPSEQSEITATVFQDIPEIVADPKSAFEPRVEQRSGIQSEDGNER